ncbi:30S ribosomal protein S15 [Trebouxia sp. C0009 RCD-2024]
MTHVCSGRSALSTGAGTLSLPLGSSIVLAGGFAGTPLTLRAPVQTRLLRLQHTATECRYRGQGTDRSKVPEYKRHTSDTGSPEVQIAQLSARVIQLTGHLQTHKKDFASRRGLLAALSTRKSLMQYLLKKDRPAYERIIRELSIRPLKVQAGRNVIIKLQEGQALEPERVTQTDATPESS